MPEYLAPGVYMEEIEIGAKPIEGVSTSTAGFLGETERGPTVPRLITSWIQYQRIYGDFFGVDKYLPYAVKGFFDNGGKRCYIGRIVKKNTDTATITLKDDKGKDALKINAIGEGLWGSRLGIKVYPGSKDSDKLFKLSIFYWGEKHDVSYDPDRDRKTTPRPLLNEIFDNISLSQDSPYYYEKTINGVSNLIEIDKDENSSMSKNNPKYWNEYETYGSVKSSDVDKIIFEEELPSDSKVYKDMSIEIIDGTGKDQIRKIVSYDKSSQTATVDAAWNTKPDNTSKFSIFWISDFDQVTDLNSNLVLSDYERYEIDIPGKRKGLNGFSDIDEISIIYSPNANNIPGLVESLITHCELLTDRFAIIDSDQNKIPDDLKPRDANDTEYAAFYYPWIKIIDPNLGTQITIPPGGHVAGIYARSDEERGVFKAPANEVVGGASDLEFQITKGEQEILNPRSVNVIRSFPGRGIRVWGARTLSSDSLWKYINVRRLFIFLEESIEDGTQWVVFEPNDEKLWARVKQTITQFLTQVWRDGALMGNTPEEAFFVKCDRTTMTQNDLDNGRLIVMIGVSPVKPAEFVIFRIAQWTTDSKS